MKKYLGLALIFGWFFTMESPYDKEAMFRALIGPFSDIIKCQAELESMKDQADSMNLPAKFSKCQFTKET
jgi:hypothetical protein